MGLDIAIHNGRNMGVASYSGVHDLRAACIMLFVRKAWQDVNVDHEACQNLLHSVVLRSSNESLFDCDVVDITGMEFDRYLVDDDSPSLSINYEEIATRCELGFGFDNCLGELIGLYKWVDHSDCDGYLSVGDVVDISLMFKFILSDLPEQLAKASWMPKIEELSAFFEEAAQLKNPILFC